MIEYETINEYITEFKKYLENIDSQTIQKDLDLMIFFEKFVERKKNKYTFKEFFEQLLNRRYKGEVQLRNCDDLLKTFDFSNLVLDDYKFVEANKDREYIITGYFEYCTCPPIPVYVVRLKDDNTEVNGF